MKTGKAQAPDEETMAHFQANPFYMEVKPIQNGKYFLRHGNDPEPDDPENTIYKYTIFYNSDFTKYSIIRKNEKPVSFGGEYIYYPLAQGVSINYWRDIKSEWTERGCRHKRWKNWVCNRSISLFFIFGCRRMLY